MSMYQKGVGVLLGVLVGVLVGCLASYPRSSTKTAWFFMLLGLFQRNFKFWLKKLLKVS